MASIREYDYKYKEDNVELEALVSNEGTAPVPDSYHELTEHCHIILWNQYPQKIKKFIEWIEETTEAKVENIWGVLSTKNETLISNKMRLRKRRYWAGRNEKLDSSIGVIEC